MSVRLWKSFGHRAGVSVGVSRRAGFRPFRLGVLIAVAFMVAYLVSTL